MNFLQSHTESMSYWSSKNLHIFFRSSRDGRPSPPWGNPIFAEPFPDLPVGTSKQIMDVTSLMASFPLVSEQEVTQ